MSNHEWYPPVPSLLLARRHLVRWSADILVSFPAPTDHFTILGVMPALVRGLSDITDLFVGKYGVPAIGSRVFIQTFQVINGWKDLPEQASQSHPEGPSAPPG
jgi:hypothetical protein